VESDAVQETPQRRVSERQLGRTTLRRHRYEGLAQIEKFVNDGGLLVTLGSGTMLALEAGLCRRRGGGRSAAQFARRRSNAAAEAQNAVTRTPGSHVRVTFARPEHPIAYGYPSGRMSFGRIFLCMMRRGVGWHGVLHVMP